MRTTKADRVKAYNEANPGYNITEPLPSYMQSSHSIKRNTGAHKGKPNTNVSYTFRNKQTYKGVTSMEKFNPNRVKRLPILDLSSPEQTIKVHTKSYYIRKHAEFQKRLLDSIRGM